MTIKIDKAGRIVLPKPVRERFHLREGSELELEERSDGLTLRPVEQRSSMVQEKGVWCLAALTGVALLKRPETRELKTLQGYEGIS
jgi:AbrB family looped-hinge helix DNA binding protein